MTRAVYLIGEPGAGKTTLMEQLCRHYTIGTAEQLEGQLWGERLWLDGDVAGIRLGRTRESFSGTDALGMAVNPDAIRWLQTGKPTPILLGEGARLANWAFVEMLYRRTNALVVLVRASNAAERRLQRGSQQNPNWVRGRATASLRLFERIVSTGYPALSLDTTTLSPLEAATIVENEMGTL